jgi:sugar lactone lactonase YvrE
MTNQRAELFIDSRCTLGEGPIWHGGRQELFWFDIDEHRLYRANTGGDVLDRWTFDEPVAAAAIIDDENLLIASASALIRFDIATGKKTEHLPLEADVPGNRSNDSRVAPGGTFWIGTMSRKGDEDQGAGAVYGYRAGNLETLFDGITIPNSICFSPDGTLAYFADTPTGRILKRAIDPQTGMPTGPFSLFADTNDLPGHPDGSVVDAQGYVWNARWGGHAVIRFAPDGSVDRVIDVAAEKVTCPSFGGSDLKTLFVTTAGGDGPDDGSHAGGVFAIDLDIAGQSEHRVVL